MKKILSMVLACALMVGCMVPTALAAGLDASAQHDINTTTGEGTSEVVVTAEATQMTVTVPVSLPASVDAQGSVTVASNAKIINKSYAPVSVDGNPAIQAATGWTAKASDYDFAKDNIGTKNFAFSINDNASTAANAPMGSSPVLDGINDTDSDEYAFTYDVKLSGQREALTNAKVADVVFTITWAA